MWGKECREYGVFVEDTFVSFSHLLKGGDYGVVVVYSFECIFVGLFFESLFGLVPDNRPGNRA